MGILDQLVEKKDILVYCDSRIAQLHMEWANTLPNTPDAEKEYVRRQLKGRILELKRMKAIAKAGHIKQSSKKQWRYAYSDEAKE